MTCAAGIAHDLLARFDAGEFDVATLFFNRFQSVISQMPTAQQVIPALFETTDQASSLYDYEPSEEGILADLLPRGDRDAGLYRPAGKRRVRTGRADVARWTMPRATRAR